MNQIKLLNSIKDYLTRFQLLVKISNEDSEYDINHHAENIIIPILNLVFNGDFVNLNYSDKKNFESLDLLDSEKRVGIQVTSTNSIEKVKSTLSKFLKYGHEKSVDELFVYILSEKQKSYSQEAVNTVLKKKIAFNVATHIIDAKDLYRMIKGINDIAIYQKINHLLELQFSDAAITDSFSFTDYQEFKNNYKEKCLNNFSRLNFFGLSVAKKPREVELYSLFVAPLFRAKNAPNYNEFLNTRFETKLNMNFKLPTKVVLKSEWIKEFLEMDALKVKDFYYNNVNINTVWDDSVEYKFDKLYGISQHLVILGNPGAGKSSMIKYSICKIMEQDEAIFEDKAIYDRLPLRIELHKYNQSKVRKQMGIVEHLEVSLASDFQVLIARDRLVKILEHFPTLIFFDGLDEIFDVQERINVRNDIENFASTYKNTQIIVTSRYESYEEVSLNDKFHKVNIQNFNNEQLENYVDKWYKIEESSPSVRSKEIQSCLEQLAMIDGELKYNPLLLSLILILYRNDLELPTNKLSIYEGCTNTIVETRDTNEKKLGISLKVSSKISVFSAIANWQFDNSNKRINNQIVQAFVRDYLIKIEEFNDEDKATQAAIEFLEFAKTRSIYFENKFTHKTFLEYFAAYYIFSNFYFKLEARKKFDAILDKNLGLSSWAVVLELLICKIDSNLLDSTVIEKIINKQLEKNTNDALLFFLQILKYLTHVNSRIVINLFNRALEACFFTEFVLKESKIDHREVLFGHIVTLYKNPRFKEAVIEGFESQLSLNTANYELLTIFAYELGIISADFDLADLMQKNGKAVETPYIFLLKNYKMILEEKTYLEALEQFITLFSMQATIPLYKSLFHQNLFLGYDRFNWNITYYVSSGPNEAHHKFKALKGLGITNDTLIKSAKQKYLSSQEAETYARLLYKLPKSGYREFLKDFIKVYFPKAVNDTTDTEKFYDKFYVNNSKKRR